MRERCPLCGRYFSVPQNIKKGEEATCPNCEANLVYDEPSEFSIKTEEKKA